MRGIKFRTSCRTKTKQGRVERLDQVGLEVENRKGRATKLRGEDLFIKRGPGLVRAAGTSLQVGTGKWKWKVGGNDDEPGR